MPEMQPKGLRGAYRLGLVAAGACSVCGLAGWGCPVTVSQACPRDPTCRDRVLVE